MKNIDNIITECIDNFLNESLISESILGDIKNMLKKFASKHILSHDEMKQKRKLKKEMEKAKKGGNKKLRKTRGGGKKYYDYDDWKRKHRKLAKGDIDSIIDMIDQEKTDIAAVAREIFPDHTEEGAQSQLRKILNRERPLTKDIASTLEKMISAGQIAVKS